MTTLKGGPTGPTVESCSDGSCTSTTASALLPGLPPQWKHGRRRLSAGAAPFIELIRLLRKSSPSDLWSRSAALPLGRSAAQARALEGTVRGMDPKRISLAVVGFVLSCVATAMTCQAFI